MDDGKSTLIGRLLYDSKSILVDQLEALEKQSRNKNADGIDLALLTDGLRAEREQGITIDVAYRYFSTPKRKFIIADAPGHVQYTRNMITGASNSSLIVILIDARAGVIEQTRRHSIIATLLKMKHVVVAINKMDLVDYSEETFNQIKEDYEGVARQLRLNNVTYIPICALNGDNIVDPSTHMNWYTGLPLLQFLEEVEVAEDVNYTDPRFQVQYVVRPQTKELPDYRGYAGEVISGVYKKGDKIKVLPQEIETTITRIESAGTEVEEAIAGQPVILHIEHDIDISRGDTFANVNNLPKVSNELEVLLCWLDNKPLSQGNKYYLQHRTKLVRTIVREIEYKVDVNSLKRTEVIENVKLNEVVRARIKTVTPIVYDSFEQLADTGSAILIDETSNSTVAAVMFV